MLNISRVLNWGYEVHVHFTALLNFVKYVDCIEGTQCQDPSHLYNYSTKKRLYLSTTYLTLLHHVSCVQTFSAVSR